MVESSKNLGKRFRKYLSARGNANPILSNLDVRRERGGETSNCRLKSVYRQFHDGTIGAFPIPFENQRKSVVVFRLPNKWNKTGLGKDRDKL